MKNKKIIILIIVAVIIIGLGIWLYMKNKKKTTASNALTASLKSSANDISTGAQTQAALLTKTNTFTKVVKDSTKGQAILRFEPANAPISVGDNVKIPSGPYAGIHKVWYIYDAAAREGLVGVKNIYIDTPYLGDTSGTFDKV
ncbi:MAG: hypothetical protein PHX80_05495 [Candidatus Nanoarchaeia archaeon]|nr:hypothetical protein [Candidatus Nanoarchaeia archaeon]